MYQNTTQQKWELGTPQPRHKGLTRPLVTAGGPGSGIKPHLRSVRNGTRRKLNCYLIVTVALTKSTRRSVEATISRWRTRRPMSQRKTRATRRPQPVGLRRTARPTPSLKMNWAPTMRLWNSPRTPPIRRPTMPQRPIRLDTVPAPAPQICLPHFQHTQCFL